MTKTKILLNSFAGQWLRIHGTKKDYKLHIALQLGLSLWTIHNWSTGIREAGKQNYEKLKRMLMKLTSVPSKIALFLALCFSVSAADLMLVWSPNPTNQGIVSYRVFEVYPNSTNYTHLAIVAGTNWPIPPYPLITNRYFIVASSNVAGMSTNFAGPVMAPIGAGGVSNLTLIVTNVTGTLIIPATLTISFP